MHILATRRSTQYFGLLLNWRNLVVKSGWELVLRRVIIAIVEIWGEYLFLVQKSFVGFVLRIIFTFER